MRKANKENQGNVIEGIVKFLWAASIPTVIVVGAIIVKKAIGAATSDLIDYGCFSPIINNYEYELSSGNSSD